jgi:16S rRNA (cytosine967-C5)-methyltransferase
LNSLPSGQAERGRAAGDGPGLAERRLAIEVVEAVLRRHRALDETLDELTRASALDDRARGLARAIATVTVRHYGALRGLLAARLAEGWPNHAGRLQPILLTGAAQILFLDVGDHAAVDVAVTLVREDRHAARYSKLANGVLRTIARERDAILAGIDPLDDDTAPWLAVRWRASYGEETARHIAAAHADEPALDVTLKPGEDAAAWAQRLDALVLSTATLRLRQRDAVPELPGYTEGAWWVQDAAAALPALCLAVRPGERVLDLCAAPGGKTAQLAAAGASVVAVDRSGPRLRRLAENMRRLSLSVETRVADALAVQDDPYDAILLDAPCSATGTLRRHPDVAWTKSDGDVARLATLQAKLLGHAVGLLRPGGRLVYCTCSLEPEEGEHRIEALLADAPRIARLPIAAGEVPGLAEAVTPAGDLRTLPFMLRTPQERLSGLDGFFVSRLTRTG